jgi:saxitoxin biosynthesis operon SxtJ-like protein
MLGPVERAWMAMAHKLSKVTTPIVMGVVYFLVVTPIAMALRLTKGNPLVHSADEGGYWFDRGDEKAPKSDMRRQF